MAKKEVEKKKEGFLLIKETKEFEIVLLENLLGTVPKNQKVYSDFIATKKEALAKNLGTDPATMVEQAREEELATVEDVEARGWTGFHADKKGLFLYEYMIKGFLKTAIEVLTENGAINKIPAYKKWIDRMVFITPRKLYFGVMKPDGDLERPLRTMTPKGERVTVARSDFIEAGRKIQFQVTLLTNQKIKWAHVLAAMTYGEFIGLGQWRGSGGYGRFQLVSGGK